MMNNNILVFGCMFCIGPIFRIAENIFLSFIIFIVTNNQLLIIEGIR